MIKLNIAESLWFNVVLIIDFIRNYYFQSTNENKKSLFSELTTW